MAKLKTFIQENGITARSEWADKNPNMDDWKDAHHYKVVLERRNPHRQMTVYFSMGSGHTKEPSAEDVLDCLCSDYWTLENGNGFEEWAEELGYDTDSRKAERTYRAVSRQSDKLRRFLGCALEEALECERS